MLTAPWGCSAGGMCAVGGPAVTLEPMHGALLVGCGILGLSSQEGSLPPEPGLTRLTWRLPTVPSCGREKQGQWLRDLIQGFSC